MIITLIAVGILILGIIFRIIRRDAWYSTVYDIGGWLIWLGTLATITICLILIAVNVNPVSDRLKLVNKHDSFEKIINSDKEIYIGSDFYDEVIDYNKDITDYQIWHDNPWVNWFWNSEVYEGLELVDLTTTEGK